MKEQDLVNFINWLIENKEAPKGASFEETISWINELSTSEDGKRMLNQLLNTYKKSNNMGLFKKGGKFDYLLCLKKGGNIQDCGCGKKIEKNQPGGEISRRDALTMLRTTGSSNLESIKEYRDAKRAARESGLRGEEMRQAARQGAINRAVDRIMPVLDHDIVVEDEPLDLPNVDFSNLDVPKDLHVLFVKPVTFTKPVSFNEAFGTARKAGKKVFEWNGKQYSTMKDTDPEYGKSPSPLGWALAEANKKDATDKILYTEGWMWNPTK